MSPAPVRSDTEHSKSGPGPHWPRRLQIPEPGTVFCPLSPEPGLAHRGQKHPLAAPSGAKHANKQQRPQETQHWSADIIQEHPPRM